MKLRVVRMLDWIDVHILGHRFYRYCVWVSHLTWWGDNER